MPLTAKLRRPTRPIAGDDGFSLIELMVVILIIGILAAIALPNFIGQRDRAEDAKAKADVRNTVTHIEACFTATDDYRKCTTEDELGKGLGIPLTAGPGGVQIGPNDKNAFVAKANSRTGATFTIQKDGTTWTSVRTCEPASGAQAKGGCTGGKW